MKRCAFPFRFAAPVGLGILLAFLVVRQARALPFLEQVPPEISPGPEGTLTPYLQLSPTQGISGRETTVVATGGQWIPGGMVSLLWDGDPDPLLGMYQVGADGTFQGTFETPTDPDRATMGEHTVVALQAGGLQAQSTFRLLGPPVVFVHGWQGLGWPGSCSRPDPRDEFWRVEQALEAAGYYVGYAGLETSPCYTPPIIHNVGRLRNAISSARAVTGYDKVILIAHSMGGLVSRAYIEGPFFNHDVSALFTFGSPHRGVPFDALVYLANGISLGKYCTKLQPAACEFTLGMDSFNKHFRNRAADVTYHLISGNAPRRPREGVAIPLYWLLAGGDDGLVQTSSGLGLAGTLDRWWTDEVHGPGSGPRSYFIRNEGESRSYVQCLKRILVYKTFTTCGSVSTLQAKADTPAPLSERTPFEFGTLLAGQTVTRTLPLEGGATLFAAQWQTSTLAVVLADPNGVTIDPEYVASHTEIVTYTADANAATYYITDTIAGDWQLVLDASENAPEDGIAYTTLAAFDSSLGLNAGTDRAWYMPGATATMTASLSDSPSSVLVTATVIYADGMSETVSLVPQGANDYETDFVVRAAPGYAQVRLRASGSLTSSLPFERGVEIAIQVSPNSVTLGSEYSDMPLPRSPGSFFYEALSITTGITTVFSGTVGLSADLVDAEENFVTHAVTIRDVLTGTSTLALRFDGSEIYASGRDGPYTLTHLLLTDDRGPTLVVLETDDAYTTADYDHRSFGTGSIHLPLILRNH
jgi:pimeloyl-ACP methyl ester carboxylesterase